MVTSCLQSLVDVGGDTCHARVVLGSSMKMRNRSLNDFAIGTKRDGENVRIVS